MNKKHLFTENNDLFDIQDEIKDFLKEHKNKLTDLLFPKIPYNQEVAVAWTYSGNMSRQWSC